MTPPRIAVGPEPTGWAVAAIDAAGGVAVSVDQPADGLVWLAPNEMGGLREVLSARPEIRWVQLPFAGVEVPHDAGLLDNERVWTCAKGSYAEPVAEHALLLALAGLRDLPRRVRARRWEPAFGTSLFDEPVTILGGGGIAESLLALLAPMRCPVTVVRRQPVPLLGAAATLTPDRLHDAVRGALVVFVALALTPQTRGIVDAAMLEAMDERAWLVNVARGPHVDTAALLRALRSRHIAGAALDVTDPEPLPEGHPLWDEPNCIITPHTADTWDMIRPRLAQRIGDNVRRFAAGEPLLGTVDPAAGY